MDVPLNQEAPRRNDSIAFRASFSGVVLAVIVSSLDQNIVAVALPRIASELGGIAYISWIVTAFLLTATIAAPIYGLLGYVVLENPGMTTASGRLPWSLSWSMTKCATELDSS
jgi:MFS family permease